MKRVIIFLVLLAAAGIAGWQFYGKDKYTEIQHDKMCGALHAELRSLTTNRDLMCEKDEDCTTAYVTCGEPYPMSRLVPDPAFIRRFKVESELSEKCGEPNPSRACPARKASCIDYKCSL